MIEIRAERRAGPALCLALLIAVVGVLTSPPFNLF